MGDRKPSAASGAMGPQALMMRSVVNGTVRIPRTTPVL